MRKGGYDKLNYLKPVVSVLISAVIAAAALYISRRNILKLSSPVTMKWKSRGYLSGKKSPVSAWSG